MLVANDANWWIEHARAALKFPGIKVCTQTGCCPFSAVFELRDTGAAGDKCGFDPDPENVRTGGNSAYAATHIAIQAESARILLCGVNMGGPNWHAPHVGTLRNTAPSTYPIWVERFKTLVEPAAERGIAILNCTPDSALRCFPFGDLEDELAACL